MNQHPKQPYTPNTTITGRTRLRAALGFVLLAAVVCAVYFGMKPEQTEAQETSEAIALMFSREPRLFLKVPMDAQADSLPEQVYVFQNDAVSVWTGAESGLRLSTLAMADGREALGMLPASCFTDAEAVWKPDPSLEVYQAGTRLFGLSGEPVQLQLDGVTLSGFRLAQDPGMAVVTASGPLRLDEPETSDHVLADPSWHDQFAFLSQHAADPACQGSQTIQETEVRDDLEGLTPGDYQVMYPMKVRVSPSLDASQSGSLAEGSVVRIGMLERPLENGPVWGRLEKGKWVCLQDENYRYLVLEED